MKGLLRKDKSIDMFKKIGDSYYSNFEPDKGKMVHASSLT
jgi:hypothetical protein